MKPFFIALMLLTGLSLRSGAQQYFNVISYGAKNDSSRLATKAIAAAITAASKKGGGTIYFPLLGEFNDRAMDRRYIGLQS